MWAGDLRKAGFPVVYFHAFASDYAGDAFLAIAGEIIALVEERKKAKSKIGKRLVENAVSTGKILLRSGLKLGVKAATLGAIAAADIEEVAGDLATEASTLADKYLGELLTKQKQQKETIQGFRDALAELPLLLSETSSETGTTSPTPKPLIFIIDELDRCRPTFSLEILERVKHFFSVPNVHFVLGVHLDQLRNSVLVAYGPKIEAQTYLQKFVHLTFFLVDQGRYRSEKVAPKFITYLRKVLDFKREDNDVVEGATELIQHVAESQDLSFRAIERIMTNLAVGLAYSPSNVIRPSPILGGLCILKVVRPDLYAKAKQGRLRYDEIKDVFGFEDRPAGGQSLRDWFAKWWRFCTEDNLWGRRRSASLARPCGAITSSARKLCLMSPMGLLIGW